MYNLIFLNFNADSKMEFKIKYTATSRYYLSEEFAFGSLVQSRQVAASDQVAVVHHYVEEPSSWQ